MIHRPLTPRGSVRRESCARSLAGQAVRLTSPPKTTPWRQEETASDVARLTAEVAQTQADLRLTREKLSEVVRERITEIRAKIPRSSRP